MIDILLDPIYNSTLHYIIDRKQLSVKNLHELVSCDYSISLSQFYKIIDTLMKNRVLAKRKGMISLHSRRILWVLDFAETLKHNYNSELPDVLLLKDGESKIYEATTLSDLDQIWIDTEFRVNSFYENEPTYMYNSHPYYILYNQNLEWSLVNQANMLSDLRCLFWNNTYLDQYGFGLYRNWGVKYISVDVDSLFLKEWYIMMSIGDYIFETLYPTEINNLFSMFFNNVHDTKDFNQSAFQCIFSVKGQYKFSIRRDKEHAKIIQKTFQKVFNEKENNKF